MRYDPRFQIAHLNSVLEEFFRSERSKFDELIDLVFSAFVSGNIVYIFGNGGSAAQAQHFAAEMVGRFGKEHRQALPVIALNTDTSIMTALMNDIAFGVLFSRQLEAFGKKNDIAVGISTSGKSSNVLCGLLAAKRLGMRTVVLTGINGAPSQPDSFDLELKVPCVETPCIQEAHLVILHMLAHEVEQLILDLRK